MPLLAPCSEWVEFTPLEVGIPKYGVFIKTEEFGSKMFMGQIVEAHEEPPLHFHMGIIRYLCYVLLLFGQRPQ